jgi:hypothetical protein
MHDDELLSNTAGNPEIIRDELKRIFAALRAAEDKMQAAQSQAENARSLMSEAAQEAIAEHLAYARLLKPLRDKYTSDKVFGQHAVLEGFAAEAPFDGKSGNKERTAALAMLGVSTHGSTPVSSFEGCANTRPVDIMKWWKSRNRKPKTEKAPKPETAAPSPLSLSIAAEVEAEKDVFGDKIKRARAIVRSYILAGKKLPSKFALSEMYEGLGATTFEKATDVERSRQETIEEFGFDVQPTSTRQAEQLDVFKKRIEADMLRQFWTQVNEEAEKIFVARKADAFPHFQKLLDDAKEETRKARRDQNNYRDFTAAQKLRMTPEQYMTVLRSVHPDNSASEETRAKAFRILTDLKFALTGKK